jgi:hypothetical protein
LRKHDVTIAAAGTVLWLAYLAVQREQPDTPIFPNLRLCGGGGSPKRPPSTPRCAPRWAASAW